MDGQVIDEQKAMLDSLGISDSNFSMFDSSFSVNDDTVSILKSQGISFEDDETTSVAEDIDNMSKNVQKDVHIDTSVSEPHLTLSKAEILVVLKYALVMIKKETRDIESSCINITFKDGHVVYSLKDNMSYVNIIGTSENTDNVFEETVSFRLSFLSKFITTAAAEFLIYKSKSTDVAGNERDVYFVRLTNGDVLVDIDLGNYNKLLAPGVVGNEMASISIRDIKNIYETIAPLINSTQEPSAKRAILFDDRAIFKSATYNLQYRSVLCTMNLSKKDLDLLRLTATYFTDADKVVFYTVNSNGENRVSIKIGNVEINTSISIPQRDKPLLDRFELLEGSKYISVNKDELKKVLYLATIMRDGTGRVTMNYNAEGLGIDVKIGGSLGGSDLMISGNNYNNLSPLSENMNIYAPQLLSLLKSFNGSNLEVALLKEGFAFRDPDMGVEAMMIYSK